MDKEQQIRINFLDEAEDYFEQVESIILGLASNAADPERLDRAMRAAHSVKGGAAMMGFAPLSKVAHRLEDFLKILRLRYRQQTVSEEVETLLLRGVDCLRQVSALHRQGTVVGDLWMANAFAKIFEPLQDLLGDLKDEDENTLMQEDEGVDPALAIFEGGVEAILDRFEQHLQNSRPEQLRQELSLTADELVAFGFMANLQPFIQLCHSIQAQAETVDISRAEDLATRSLKLWRRSHALVMRGSLDKLPDRLEGFAKSNVKSNAKSNTKSNHQLNSKNNSAIAVDAIDPQAIHPSSELDPDLPLANIELADADFDLATSFDGLQELTELDASKSSAPELELELEPELELDFEPDAELEDFFDFSLDEEQDLAELQAAFSTDDSQLEDFDSLELTEIQALETLQGLLDAADNGAIAEPDIDSIPEINSKTSPQTSLKTNPKTNSQPITESTTESIIDSVAGSQISAHTKAKSAKTNSDIDALLGTVAPPLANQIYTPETQSIRVPVEQLKQFNNLFGKLVLERNTVNLQLDQLKNFVALMRQRIYQLDRSNTKLRKWYDRASLEGIVPAIASEEQSDAQPKAANPNHTNGSQPRAALQDSFDALEMDRYSDLHLISQEQIETIVQLQEVSADIDLELQDMTMAVQNLNQTTQSLQGNVTRTQMLSFAEAVKRYPRAVRDLSSQFNKPVNLVIEGESTLMDRAVLEALGIPIMHLLRNAFDHGIEDRQTRLALGKPAKGTIKLSAVNRGLQTVITLQDDGGGIRLDKIRDRARAMGLSDREINHMSESDLLNCIFEPGFSTAAQVTELSGRGMGMDIVRTTLKNIRGDIQVQSKPGVGTTFTLRVPFTLSILRVMLLEQAGIVFAVPADTVKEVQRLEADSTSVVNGSVYLNRDDEIIPLVFLEQHLAFQRVAKPFAIAGTPIINQPVALVVGENTDITGSLHISRHWGEQEVTLRSIDSPLPLPSGFISSIVLGDGRVVPLVDPLQLVEWCLVNNDLEQNGGDRQSLPKAIEPDQTPTVLIVDDSVNVRRYLALTLEKAGYQVEQAKDGQDAVDKINSGLPIQAVICDIEMPRLDGYGVLEAVKEKLEFQHLPFAMLTSRSNEKHRKLAMNLGASAYFSKPYEEQHLLQTLAELIAQAESSYALV